MTAAAGPSPLRIRSATIDADVVVSIDGVLDSTTYQTVRDAVVKAALEQPRAVLVIVDDLVATNSSAWAVFTSARWHVHQWPDVPISLVCADAAVRRTMGRLSIERYVPVYSTLGGARAAAAAGAITYRRRSRRVLTVDDAGLDTGRRFVAAVLSSWFMAERIPVASMVAHAFAENVVTHTASTRYGVRLETDGVDLVVAVSDSAAAPAVRRERSAAEDVPRGLDVVAALSRQWGCSPTIDGKTVWAVVGPGDGMSGLATLF